MFYNKKTNFNYLHKNAAVPAISSGWPTLFIKQSLFSLSKSSFSQSALLNPVLITPGAIQFILIPIEAQAGAMAFVIPTNVVLLIEYGAINYEKWTFVFLKYKLFDLFKFYWLVTGNGEYAAIELIINIEEFLLWSIY